MLYTTQLVRGGVSSEQESSAPETWVPLGTATAWLLSATTSRAADKGTLKWRLEVSFDGSRWSPALTTSVTINSDAFETHLVSIRASDLSASAPLLRVVWWTDGISAFVDMRATGRWRSSTNRWPVSADSALGSGTGNASGCDCRR